MDTCKYGHPWDEANTYWAPDGSKRNCRQCHYDRRARKGSSVCPHCGGSKPHVKKWCVECCTDTSDYRRLVAYDLARPEFDAMYFEQDGACAICHINEATHVDHNHETGEVRELLCHSCNIAIGLFLEDPQRLVSAVLYLMEHNG